MPLNNKRALEEHIIWAFNTRSAVLTTQEIITTVQEKPGDYDSTTIKTALNDLADSNVLTHRIVNSTPVWARPATPQQH